MPLQGFGSLADNSYSLTPSLFAPFESVCLLTVPSAPIQLLPPTVVRL